MFRVLVVIALLMLTALPVALAQDECAPQDGCYSMTYGLPDAAILASPTPEVERLLPNDGQLYSHGYRRVLGAVDIYDAPGGQVIGTRPDGRYFVTVQQEVGEWAEINSGEWIRAEQLGAAPISRLGGVMLDSPTAYPVGWIRSNVVPSQRPGARPADGELALVSYTLVNVYAEQRFGAQTWAQEGINQWVTRDLVAVIRPIERPAEVDSQRWVAVDLSQQILTAYEGDTPVFAALVATGIDETPTTPGLFHVYVRHHRDDMSSEASSPFYYYMEDVPYTMYFNGNMALHGAYWHDGFGTPRSHGCVNLSLTDAYWLYGYLSDAIDQQAESPVWPAVYVYGAA